MADNTILQNDDEVDVQRPFPGMRSFEEKNQSQFGGRDAEVKELFLLTRRNGLTIVFGKSGIGKTSILKAGLMPHLRKNLYYPVYFRIDYAASKTPLSQLKEIVSEKFKEADASVPEIGDCTLWEYFHDVKLTENELVPVLILDQFEETFTVGQEKSAEVTEMITQLSDLAENRIPFVVHQKYQASDTLIPSQYERQNYRVIISLREDYLAQLESLKNYMPSLLFSRDRIVQMTALQAMDAVLKSSKGLIDNDVAMAIIKKLPGITDHDFDKVANNTDQVKRLVVEPFLLSLICYQINEKRIEKGLDKFTLELVSEFQIKDIISSFYNDTMVAFGANVRTGIEDTLLTEGGYRKLESLEQLESQYKIDDSDIAELINKRIIRQERRDGVTYVELIHDLLVPVIKESRDKRIKELKEAAEKKEMARKRKERRLIFASVLAALIISIIFIAKGMEKENREGYKDAAGNLIDKANFFNSMAMQIAKNDPTQALQFEYAALDSLEFAKHSIDTLKSKHYWFIKPDTTELEENYQAILTNINQQSDSLIRSNDSLHKALYKIVLPANNKDINNSDTGATKYFVNEIFPDTTNDSLFRIWNWNDTTISTIKSKGHLKEVVFPAAGKVAMSLYDDGTAGYCDSNFVYWKVPDNKSEDITSITPVHYLLFKYKMLSVLNGKIIEWDLHSTTRHTYINDSIGGKVVSLAISHSRKMIFTASEDGKAIIWKADVNSKKIDKWNQLSFNIGLDIIKSSAFSNNDAMIVTGSVAGGVKVWNLNGKMLWELNGNSSPVNSVAFSRNDDYLYTGSVDGTYRRWRLKPTNDGGNTGPKTLKALFDKIIAPIDSVVLNNLTMHK